MIHRRAFPLLLPKRTLGGILGHRRVVGGHARVALVPLQVSLPTMAVHSGRLLHQAAPGRDLAPGDERITVQGHGVLAGGVWELYW
jgi:hypothetical protein